MCRAFKDTASTYAYQAVTQSDGHYLDYSDGYTEPGALNMPPI